MTCSRSAIAAISLLIVPIVSQAQVVLTGTGYTEGFGGLGSGLPVGWTVWTSASSTTFGTSASFSSTQETWASSTNVFRNISSDNIAFGSNSTLQGNNTNRALGWRPLGASSAAITPSRTGAVMVEFADTLNKVDLSLSLEVFQASNTGGVQTYALEYRVGSTGSFTQLGTSYTTVDLDAAYTDFHPTTFSFGALDLAPLENQSGPVYLRLRGLTSTGSSNMDLIGIDDFSLSYTVIPEPATYAAMFGLVSLAVVIIRRRMRR